MRNWVFGCLAAVSLATSAGAQEALRPVPGIEDVIRQQMQAFSQEDVATAFGFASPGIQGMFGSAGNFGRMVREGYPMVWDNDSLRFGELREIEGGLWQQVIVTDESGALHSLDYRMEQIDGEWRIAGVQILRAPALSA
ncbi:DUF4864 domain-containing protein [Salipiger mucosus]|uniref:DUF4864 domain-containing protein n=1 Tax=Salipiger mucosus DSM 16094 TaxID=1123237 RepID=S9SK37_9RHOB|nr:DUF4864 domain-containing protein [Salipiger mucosus]EPX86724.1 hypothetical protein Salmuc_01201 [Salipiger mucosus DSM 16094]